MKDIPNIAGKRNPALAIGALFLVAWLGALAFAVKDTFFSERTPAAAKNLPADTLQIAGMATTRYKILDRRHEELAVSFMMSSVYARPLEIADPEKGVGFLAEALGLDEKTLLRDLKAERTFVWLGRHLPAGKTEAIQNKGLPGVYIINESQRYYPYHQTASHALGFIKDDHGLNGLESYYDRMLRVTEEDAVSSATSQDVKGHVVLALDIRIQELLEKQLGILMSEVDAGSAVGVVMRPASGAILAMSSLPTYDPNLFWDFGAAERRNLAVDDLLHLSGFNRLFRLAAFYEGEVRASGTEGVSPGSIEALKMSLKGEQQPRVAKAGSGYFGEDSGDLVSTELLWPEEFQLTLSEELKFKERIGLTIESKIDLPVFSIASSPGQEKDPAGRLHDTNEPGKKTTAVNMIAAFSRIINDASPVTPHLATEILGPHSGKTAKLRHEKVDNVLSPETGRKLRKFLAGFAKNKAEPVLLEAFHHTGSPLIDRVAGDADIPAAGSEGLPGPKKPTRTQPPRYQSVLVGFAPVDQPDLVMLIVVKDAAVALDRKSPMRAMAEKNINIFRKLANEAGVLKQEKAASIPHAKAYQEWLKSHEGQKKTAEVDSGSEPDRMPDLRGMSLRKALQVIQPLGFTVRVSGSGEVVSHDPGPGKKISKEICVIELKEARK